MSVGWETEPTIPTSIDGFEITWSRREELDEVTAILSTHWVASSIFPRSRELLDWSCRFCREESRGFLRATRDGQLAGFIFVNLQHLSVLGKFEKTCFPSMVKSLFAGAGRMLLGNFLNEISSHVISLGANAKSQSVWTQIGTNEYASGMPRWWYIVSAQKVRSMYRSHGLEWSFAVGSRAHIEPEEWQDWIPGDEWDETFEKVIAPQIIGTWKDTSYINWRYITHPTFQYHVKRPPSGKGLIVYRIAELLNEAREPTGFKAMRVVDFLVDPEEGAAMGARLIQEAEATDCAFIDFYCSSVKFGLPLQEAGFSLGEAMLPSLFSPLDFEFRPVSYGIRIPGISIHDPRLYLTRSDADQDRPN